ncbi:MAG: T9SS type A sorting domain-containing protein, partial [Janthinobacterium lividum]
RYYVEVLHKEGDGGDFVSVGWTLPDGTAELPIAGSRLMPFVAGSSLVGTQTASASATALVAKTKAENDATLLTDNVLDTYPNPFTDQTTVEFTLLTAGPAKLSVYDTRNQLVRLVYNGQAEAGVRKQFTLSGAGLPPGVYLLQLVTGTNVITKKLLRAD